MNYGKLIGAFGVGVITGAVSAYFYYKKKLTEKENEVAEVVAEVREHYFDKLKENDKELNKILDQTKDINNVVEEYAGKEKARETGDLRPSDGSQKIEYHKLGKEEEKEMAEKEVPEEEKPDSPYFITEDEFNNDCNEYDKLSFCYYTGDDTLTDECDEITDIDQTIGVDIYNQLAGMDGDIYVRNDAIQTDFEIVKIDRSYGNDMYGDY